MFAITLLKQKLQAGLQPLRRRKSNKAHVPKRSWTNATSILLCFGLLFGCILTLLSLMAWGMNLVVAFRQISDPAFQAQWASATHSLLTYVITVDYSTATTLVGVLTAGCFTRGMYRLYQAHTKHAWALVPNQRNMPFWPGYKALYSQLGLLGTLFGFIVAFKETTGASPEKILGALGTALWSSFMAIAFAFLICPPIEKLFQLCLRRGNTNSVPGGMVRYDMASLTTALAGLYQQITKVTTALERLEHVGAVENMLREWAALQTDFAVLKGQLNEQQHALAQGLAEQHAGLDALTQKQGELTKQLQQLQRQRRKAGKDQKALGEFIAKLLAQEDDAEL